MAEAEELNNLEELEAVEGAINGKMMALPCIGQCQRTLVRSPAAAILLDESLRIFWVNWTFEQVYGISEEAVGNTLISYFKEDLKEKKAQSLYKSINSAEQGHNWYGRLEKKGKDSMAIIANLLLLPLYDYNQQQEKPIGYQGIFDDISGEFRLMLKNTYESLLGAARLKDNDTGNHIQRVNRYSQRMAEVLESQEEYPQVDREFIENIGFLAAMHDVGKIGTPDDILNKAGPLETWEWEIMKDHTINGAYILASYPHPMAKEIGLRHHEHWDGKGYPHGVSGDLIPISARIVSLADVYDALRMKRAYKKSFSHEKAVQLIIENRGTQFDPGLVSLFERMEKDFHRIYDDLKDSEDPSLRRPAPQDDLEAG